LGLNPQDDEKALNAAKHERSEERANERDLATTQITTSQDGCSDRGKFHRRSKTTVGVTYIASLQDSCERREETAHDKNAEFDFGNVDTAGIRRSSISANGKNPVTQRSVEDKQMNCGDNAYCRCGSNRV
jgi:hypothetical protein